MNKTANIIQETIQLPHFPKLTWCFSSLSQTLHQKCVSYKVAEHTINNCSWRACLNMRPHCHSTWILSLSWQFLEWWKFSYNNLRVSMLLCETMLLLITGVFLSLFIFLYFKNTDCLYWRTHTIPYFTFYYFNIPEDISQDVYQS